MGMRVPSSTTNARLAFFAAPSAASSLGARAASKATVSCTYRQAVVVPTPKPAARPAKVSPLLRVDQGQQGLLAGVQLAPARADLLAVPADYTGQVGQRGTRQRQSGTVEKHRSP